MGSPWSRPDRVKMLYGRLAKMFKIARPYTMFIPLYGCLWSMCACSDSTDVAAVNAGEIDIRIANRGLSHLQYYNGAAHQALFAFQNFACSARPAFGNHSKQRLTSAAHRASFISVS